jgi:hypothetical protein
MTRLPVELRKEKALQEIRRLISPHRWIKICFSVEGEILINHGSIYDGREETAIQTIKVRPNGHVVYLTHP